MIIISSFKVPRADQQKVLLFGIVFSLIARTGFIFLGAALINTFAWVFYVFGLILIVTAGNLLKPGDEPVVPYVTQKLGDGEHGDAPVVAVSDWMRAVPDQIRQWSPAPFLSLGTDGFGLSDTRPAVRRHFAVDAESIVVGALSVLAKQGLVKTETAAEAAAGYKIDDPQAAGPQIGDGGAA